MSNFELIPFSEANPSSCGKELYECLQDEDTRRQLERFMPAPLDAYDLSAHQAAVRIKSVAELTENEPDFQAYIQTLDDRAIGIATIDNRLEVHKHRLLRRKFIGKLAVEGANTASWIGAEYQGQGLGRQSLEQRIQLAKEAYGGVWTLVDKTNKVSRSNVTARGFEPVYAGKVWVDGEEYKDAIVFQHPVTSSS